MNQFERVGAYEYAIARPCARERRSWSTDWKSVAVWVGAAGFLFLFAWVPLRLIRIGSPLAGPLVTALSFTTFFGGYAAIIVWGFLARKGMKSRGQGEQTRSLSDVPRSAISVVCCVRSADCLIARSPGELWLEGPYLHFRGEGFDFKLGRAAFEQSHRISSTVYPWQVRLPGQQGLPWTKLRVRLQDSSREQRERLRTLVETWVQRVGGREGTVLPPIRIIEPIEPLWPLVRWALIRGLFSAGAASAMMLAIRLEAPPEVLPKEAARVVPGIACFVPVMLLMAWYAQVASNRSVNQKIEKVRSGRS